MKRVYIVRHAKSSWGDLSLNDHDRPLNKRGFRDAPMVAAHCKRMKYIPQAVYTSTALRALTTANIFTRTLIDEDFSPLQLRELYHAPAEKYLETIYGIDENISSVMLFGHNPGITYFANEVSDTFIDNVPTSGVLVCDFEAKKWVDVDFSNGKLVDFIFPKKLL